VCVLFALHLQARIEAAMRDQHDPTGRNHRKPNILLAPQSDSLQSQADATHQLQQRAEATDDMAAEASSVTTAIHATAYRAAVAGDGDGAHDRDGAPARLATVDTGARVGTATTAPKGVYIWGSVGCGKTMLVDLFYDQIDVGDERKQRVSVVPFFLA
jgi:predicted ATPase